MDVLQPPDLATVEDFQFKYQSKTRIFDSVDGLPNGPCNMLAVASNHGLVFVGTVRRELLVFHLKDVIDHEEENCRCRVIPLPNVPYFLAVNCTHEILCVVLQKNTATVALFYDIKSVSAETPILLQEIIMSTHADAVINAIQWNPVIADMIAVCTSDGNLSVYELKQSSFIIQTKPTTARCLCWSPKGKQLVTGNSDSTLSQYKPDLTFVKTIPAPKIFNNQSQCIAIHWITNFQFSVIYSDPSDLDSRPCVTIVNTPKGANASCINYEDICYSTGNIRPVHYFLQNVAHWGVMMASSSNGIEVGVLGCREQAEWKQWSVNDEARAELPLTSNKQENYPIGIAFDTAAVHQLTYGENEVMPHMPLLHILSHTGLLVTFNVINANPSAPNVCTPADFIVMPDRFLKSLKERSGNVPENKTVAPVTNNQSSLFEQPSFLAQQGAITSTPVLPKSNSPFALSDASKPPIATNLFATKLSQMQPSVQDKPPASNAFALNANLSQTFSSAAQSQPFSIPLTQSVAPQQDMPVIPAARIQRTEQKSVHIAPLENTTTHKPLINATLKEDTIKKVLLKEANDFQMEVYDLLLQAYKVDAKIGNSEDIDEINKTMKQLRLELSSICEVSDLRSQVDDLKKDIIHSLSIIADAKAQSSTHELHQVAKLDPVSAKQQTSIKRLLYYVDMQMRQANQVLDQQWETFQNDCRSKLKITGNDLMIKPSLETVYQPLIRQQEILGHQRSVLAALKKALESSGIATKNKPHETLLKLKYTAKKSNEDPLSKLAKNILNLSLEPTDIITSKYRAVCDNYAKLTPMKLNALRERFVNHRTIKIKPVKVEIPPMSKMYNLDELAEEVIETNNDIIKCEKEPQFIPQKPVNFSVKVEQKLVTSNPQTFTITQPVATKPQPLSQSKPAEIAKPKPIVSTAANAINFSTSIENPIPTQANSIFNTGSLFTALSQPQSQPELQKTPKPTATFAAATSISTPNKEVKPLPSESFLTSKAPSAFTAAVPKNQAATTPLSPFQLKTTESFKVSPVITTASSSFAPMDKKENTVPEEPVGKVSTPIFTSLPTSTPVTISTSFTSPITTSIFGTVKTESSNNSIFGSPKSESSAASIFATAKPESSATSIFGTAKTVSSSTSIFGTAKTESSGTSIFGTAKTESLGTSIFDTAKTESSGSSIFGTAKTESSGTSIFATAKTETSTPSIFGTAKTESSAASIFASKAIAPATVSSTGTNITQSTGSIFGSLMSKQTSPSSIFGVAAKEATTDAPKESVFRSAPFFGLTAPAPDPEPPARFGAAFASAGGSPFAGTPASGGSLFSTSPFSSFGTPAPQQSIFGGPTGGAFISTQSPVFGSQAASLFGAAAAQSPSGSIFGSPQTGGSVFGASPVFGSKPLFSQTPAFGSTIPSGGFGSFSSNDEQPTVAQAGFGSPNAFQKIQSSGFGAPPSLGGSPTSAFGAVPAFGSSPLANTSHGPFGAPTPTGFGTPSQQSSTFENLANQNTPTFGNLAQQTPGAAPQPQPFQTSPSFSGWRG